MKLTQDKALIDIDNKIDFLVKKIELLNYINPTNIQEQKALFFASKFTVEPKFEYPQVDFNSYELQRALFSVKIEEIDDKVLRNLYEDIIYEYSGLIECIDTIGKGKKFYYNSLRCFGSPKEVDVENAKFILHFENENVSLKSKHRFNVDETEEQFRAYSKRYEFSYSIKHSDKLTAIAMVLNNEQSLILNSNYTFSQADIDILTNHEIGVHMVTTMNALRNPLKIFSHGFPNNTETQEGLAVFSEFMSDSLNMSRLKRIAYRVLAVDSLAKGYTFSKTFRMLCNYGMSEEGAYTVSVRVHRGGGFTKDYLYLTGLRNIYDFYSKGFDLKPLLTGKVSLEYIDSIEYLIDNGFAVPSKHITDSYQKNSNTNKNIAFILENLK
ncbi:flavohemoglobin expression-modulating QEGLA motif protein [Urechidicola croceus]|uniref:DUF1704 domain-containing protein n=1 Tax=Urechidicola croceus TaxID=1850246 RepID=A0A1D8P4F7_9FLAO|nr:tyrosine/phenylalanine carboxypeptidase domain-containing protein [Urechidicola croceus]AOW19464.1 hypothetical protein LPB138_01635 [Urechidicola croceus]